MLKQVQHDETNNRHPELVSGSHTIELKIMFEVL